jgi:putative NIF3 family GTP cyclohydrolase 1 type 2
LIRAPDLGPAEIRDAAVVTGVALDHAVEAAAKGVDAVVMGEAKQKTYHEAQEADLTVALVGHYVTATSRAENPPAWTEDDWAESVETTFFDVPTGL